MTNFNVISQIYPYSLLHTHLISFENKVQLSNVATAVISAAFNTDFI